MGVAGRWACLAGCTVEQPATEPRRAGHPPDDHPHGGHSLAVVPLQLRPEQVRSGLRPAPGARAVRRHRAHRDAGQAHPQRVDEPLAVARLRRLLPGRAGVQRVQGRGRDARAVARGHGRRGARQPRVRPRLAATCSRRSTTGRSSRTWPRTTRSTTRRIRRSARCATSSTPYRDLRRQGPQDRRDRHGQPGHAARHLRGRQLARLPADRRHERCSTQYVRLLRPVVDLVVVVSHLGLDEDEGLPPSQVDDPEPALARQGRRPRSSAATSTSSPTRRSSCPTTTTRRTARRTTATTLLVHSGAFAKYVGRLDLVVHVGIEQRRPREAQPHRVVRVQQPIAGRRDRCPTIRRSRTCCGRTRSSSTRTSTSTACSRTSTRRAPRRSSRNDPIGRRLAARQPGRARDAAAAAASRPSSRSPTRSASAPTSSAAR